MGTEKDRVRKRWERERKGNGKIQMGQRKTGKENEIDGAEKDRGRKRWDRERKGKRKR